MLAKTNKFNLIELTQNINMNINIAFLSSLGIYCRDRLRRERIIEIAARHKNMLISKFWYHFFPVYNRHVFVI